NPLRHGVFSMQLLSHKVLRYLAIIFMVTALFTNMFLAAKSLVFRFLLVAQAVFYGAAAAGWAYGRKNASLPNLLYIPYYFCLVNIAAAHAILKFLRGEKQVTWTPRKG
ncbi:MAG TPA: glycosyltransferase family 2 protein, partial [Deltaproteobacteria bacterium]|nr:glycosyltransferase family 2 protein [Deltaproteobacteria bacterium]